MKVMTAIEDCRTAARPCEAWLRHDAAISHAARTRRFMLHVLPKGFHRIRHYRLLASGPAKAARIERARELIAAAAQPHKSQQHCDPAPASSADKPAHPCPCCGARMVIIETFQAGCMSRHRPTAWPTAIRIDTS